MRKSIRWRLQLWYGLVLLVVVIGFAAVLYARVRSARLRDIDAELEASARYLDVLLRRFPHHEFDPGADERPPPPPPPRNDLPRRPPFPPREMLFAELILPKRVTLPGETDRAPVYFAIWRSDGSLLKSADWPDGRVVEPHSLRPVQQPRLAQSGEYREAVMLGPGSTTILVGKSIRHEQAALTVFAWQLAGGGAIALLIGLAGGWLVSSRILRPVAAITSAASQISADNLDQRIDAELVDVELAQLARVLNAMFERLQAAFARQAQFTADASHELRTPLAVIRTHAELALARPRALDEYRAALEATLRAVERMTSLVEGLLFLARADAGKLDVRREPVDLRPVIEASVSLLCPLAEQKGVHLRPSLTPATVVGDADRLSQVVANLVTNAIQHTPAGGNVDVRVTIAANRVELTVADTGAGIPTEDQPHLFERFYRVDKARSRTGGGHGLGLAITKSIVVALGGDIDFRSESGKGTTFRVRLPAFDSNEQTG